MAYTNKALRYIGLGILCSGLLNNIAVSTTMDKVDNWDVDGAHGLLFVKGSLTESACRLAMSSEYQTINMGNIGTGQLQRIGSIASPVAVTLRLEDCLSGESRAKNNLGNLLWSPDMPSMKIRFLAPADKWDPRLVAVKGAKGIGLQLSDALQHPITIGQYDTPALISPGQNTITYYVTPVRTAFGLSTGIYEALIQFQVSYE